MKHTMMVSAAIVSALIGLSLTATAGPLQNMEKALVHLQKARATTAVKVKTDSLKSAKEQILQSKYNKNGYGSSAVALIMQAMKYISDFKLDKANTMIDASQVKVKHAIQAIKQEAAAKSRTGGK